MAWTIWTDPRFEERGDRGPLNRSGDSPLECAKWCRTNADGSRHRSNQDNSIRGRGMPVAMNCATCWCLFLPKVSCLEILFKRTIRSRFCQFPFYSFILETTISARRGTRLGSSLDCDFPMIFVIWRLFTTEWNISRENSRQFFRMYDTLSSPSTAKRRLTEGRQYTVWYIRMLRPGAWSPFAFYWSVYLLPPTPTTRSFCPPLRWNSGACSCKRSPPRSTA